MKKAVVLAGSLILAFAFCVPLVAQPNAKSVETQVIDNFDTDAPWQWSAQGSRMCTTGYPIVKKFEGIPNSLVPLQKPDVKAMVLGMKTKFNRKGDNWVEIYPTKDGKPFEYEFVGTVKQIDVWVWGANYNYTLEMMVRDGNGRVYVLPVTDLNYKGWKECIVTIPTSILQHSTLRSGRPNMSFVGFRVRSGADAPVDDFVIYFDNLLYATNTLDSIYDGYTLQRQDFGDNK